MSDEQEISGVDEAWAEFRRRLADHLAAMEEHEVLRFTVEQAVPEDELDGAWPYVQFCGWGEGAVRAEVCSNTFLAVELRIGLAETARLEELGWAPPNGKRQETEDGSPHFWADGESRDADRIAAMTVAALREAYGCPHPAFLEVDGETALVESFAALRSDDETEPEPRHRDADAGLDEEPGWPTGRDELRAMIDTALTPMLGEDIHHDDDGDVVIGLGRSVLFVRAWASEPMVELYAELVHDVADLERAASEVAILNRDLALGTCTLRDDAVVLRHRVVASPFVHEQLRSVVARISSDLETTAEDLACRVRGWRFLDVAPEVDDGDQPANRGSQAAGMAAAEEPGSVRDGVPGDADAAAVSEPLDPRLVALRELLADDEVDAPVVAALFDGDLDEIAEVLESVRTDPPTDLDVADVLAALRGALRFVAGRRADELFRIKRPFPKRRQSQQPSLISPRELGEDSLDLGVEG